MGTLANREDPDEMQHLQSESAVFAEITTTFTDRITYHNLENSTFDPLNCTMGCPILIVSICI